MRFVYLLRVRGAVALRASLFDGIMVALIRMLDQADRIREHATQINRALQAELGNPEFYELVSGKANTREATRRRASYIKCLIESVTAP